MLDAFITVVAALPTDTGLVSGIQLRPVTDYVECCVE
jgi:hypothetical protein